MLDRHTDGRKIRHPELVSGSIQSANDGKILNTEDCCKTHKSMLQDDVVAFNILTKKDAKRGNSYSPFTIHYSLRQAMTEKP